MRKVKFRVYDKEDKRMIVDEQDFIPLKITNKGVLRLNPFHEEDFWEFICDDRFIKMQSTGIKDMDGVEIYEGDVLSCECENNCSCDNVVRFKNGCFVVNDKLLCEVSFFKKIIGYSI